MQALKRTKLPNFRLISSDEEKGEPMKHLLILLTICLGCAIGCGDDVVYPEQDATIECLTVEDCPDGWECYRGPVPSHWEPGICRNLNQ